MTSQDPLPLAFERHRRRLFGIAYRMLGSIHDAEDVVQDAYVRWQQVDVGEVRAPEGWLVAVTTRLSIDRLRRASTERQTYVGDWLPEPILTSGVPSADHASELASDLSVAFLLLLERLAPEERAAFLLREVFDRGYEEIASAIGRTSANTRQMVHRARERVRDGGRRVPVTPDEHAAVLGRFVQALHTDDENALLALLAPAVKLTSDSGGKVSAARRTVVGADRVARFLLGLQRKWYHDASERIESINGESALVAEKDGRVLATTLLKTDGTRVLAVYRILNPDKLRGLRAVERSSLS